MKRLLWLILFVSLLFVFMYSICRAETSEYTVQPGDTLGTIAGQYKMSWEELWNLNKDIVVDPNKIFVGQKLRVSGVPVTPKELSRKEFEGRIELLIMSVTFKDKLTVRDVQSIATAIGEVYIVDKDKANMLTAIAWQETHFWNRRGKHGEVSIFQLMPATIRRYGGDPVQIEQNVRVATAFASTHLAALKEQHKTWERVLYRWNWSQKYVSSVMHKYYKVRGMLL